MSGGSGHDADMIVRVLAIHKVVDADVTVIQKSHLAGTNKDSLLGATGHQLGVSTV